MIARCPVSSPGSVVLAGREEFFKLSARHSIEPGAKLEDLVHDCALLLNSGAEVFDAMFEDLPAPAWAGLYTLRQASQLIEVIQRLLQAQDARVVVPRPATGVPPGPSQP